jgi:hypothetical protein
MRTPSLPVRLGFAFVVVPAYLALLFHSATLGTGAAMRVLLLLPLSLVLFRLWRGDRGQGFLHPGLFAPRPTAVDKEALKVARASRAASASALAFETLSGKAEHAASGTISDRTRLASERAVRERAFLDGVAAGWRSGSRPLSWAETVSIAVLDAALHQGRLPDWTPPALRGSDSFRKALATALALHAEAKGAEDRLSAETERARARTQDDRARWLAKVGTADRDFLVTDGWDDLLDGLEGCDPHFWHEIATEAQEYDDARLRAALRLVEDPDCDVATVCRFLQVMVSDGEGSILRLFLDGLRRTKGEAAMRAAWTRFTGVIDRLNAGFHRHQTVRDSGSEVYFKTEEALFLSDLRAVASALQLPEPPMPVGVFRDFPGGPETRDAYEPAPYTYNYNEGLMLIEGRDDGLRPEPA